MTTIVARNCYELLRLATAQLPRGFPKRAPRRLGLVISFADANRNVAPSPFGGPWPARIAITVILERHAGIGRGTLLTLRSTPLDASDAELDAFREAMSSMEVGWGQMLESLAGFLSTAR